MQLQCPHCGFARTVEPGRVPPGATRVRCPNCEQYFPLSAGSVSSPQGTGEFQKLFYLGEKARRIMTLLLGAAFLLSALVLVLTVLKVRPVKPELIFGIGALLLVQGVVFGFVAWTMRTPVVEITATTFTYWPVFLRGRFNVGKKLLERWYRIRWQDVVGYDIRQSDTSGFKVVLVRFDLKSDGPVGNERLFRVTTEHVAELTALIGRFAPQQALAAAEVQNRIVPPSISEVVFRDWKLTYSGIDGPQGQIEWRHVKRVDYPPFVIGGYGNITVVHEQTGYEVSFSIPAQASAQYQDFARFLVCHAKEAKVAPGVAKMLGYPVSETRKELAAIGLLISGAVLTITTGNVVDYFAEASLAREFYVLLPYTLAALTGFMAIRALSGRFQGKMTSGGAKLFWAAALNLSQPLAILIIGLASSFFFNYLSGYVHEVTGSYPAAEQHYLVAWTESPKNVCTAFDLALLYRKQGKHAQAYEYFEKAYSGDPGYWAGPAIALIPDSLAQMGEIERARQRCDELLEENRNKRRIVEALLEVKGRLAQKG